MYKVGDQLLESCCPLAERGVMQHLSWDLYLQVYTIYNENNLGFLGLFRGGTFDLYGTYSVWETLPNLGFPHILLVLLDVLLHDQPSLANVSDTSPPILPQGLTDWNWWWSLELVHYLYWSEVVGDQWHRWILATRSWLLFTLVSSLPLLPLAVWING